MHAVGEEGDEDVRFDARFILVINGSQRQIALEVFEGFFDVAELHIEFPEFGRILAAQITAQEVAAFAPPRLPQFAVLRAKVKVCGVTGWRGLGI